jgi:hypothetical protein
MSPVTYRFGDYLVQYSLTVALTEFATGATLSPYTATWLPAPTRKFFSAARPSALLTTIYKFLPNHSTHYTGAIIKSNSRILPMRQGLWRHSERFSGDHAKS